jgi:hypothetical protein
MARPQNSAKGRFAKSVVEIAAGGGLPFATYGSSNLLSANSTGLVLAGGVKISNAFQLRANSTCALLPTVTAKPATRQVGGLVFVSNSTGKMLSYHSTGTTWAYLAKTSVLA